LKEWLLEGHKEDWKTNVYGQCKSWIDNGLQPRAMTRDLDWGVKVPLPGTDGKVLYVWFDAPIGYISATKEYFELLPRFSHGDEVADDTKIDLLPLIDAEEITSAPEKPSDLLENRKDRWQDYWQSEDSRLIHFIGKDNIVFHCIIFPAILHAHGEYIVPDNVPANEFLNLEGEKLSTSRNWAVWLHEYLQDFPGKQDELRYVLNSILPETSDSDFSWKDFQTRVNSELVNILGNFVNRTMVLTRKYFHGKVPEAGELNALDDACIQVIVDAPSKISGHMEAFRFREALTEMMNVARAGNKYLTENEPWKLFTQDEQRVKTTLYISLNLTACLAAVCEPFLPNTSAKLYAMLKLEKRKWSEVTGFYLEPHHQLGETKLLFEKIEDEQVQFQLDKLHGTSQAVNNSKAGSPPSPDHPSSLSPSISYEDFSRMELKIGTIEAAIKVAKADKLLQLTINLGDGVRTIVSGIAEHYSPGDIIGQQVCVIANLAPRKIKGIESKGMILMAEDEKGKLRFVMPSEKMPDGSKVS